MANTSRSALATREAQLLALEIEHLDHVLKSQEPIERK
jgi:hypothetical protein